MKKILSFVAAMLLGLSSMNAQTLLQYDKSRLTGWDFPSTIKQGETLKVPYQVYTYADDLQDVVVKLLVNGETADTKEVGTIVVDEDFGEGVYTGLFEYVPSTVGTIEIQLTLDFYGAELDTEGEHETDPVSIEVVDASTDTTPVFENLAELKAYEPTSLGLVKVKLNNAKVTYVNPNTDNAVLEDASAGFLLNETGLSAQLEAGQVLNGELVLTAEEDGWFGTILYKGVDESLANVEVTTGEVTPMVVTDDNVLDFLGDFDYRLVKFTDATFNDANGEYTVNIPVLGGSVGIMDVFRAIPDNQWPADGAKVNVIGFYADYFGLLQYLQPIAFESETTGIKDVKTNQDDAPVYNLNGVRVAAPQKGLYIQNGKKMLVK